MTPPVWSASTSRGSGTEAVEAALKLARLNGRRRLVSMVGGYHGKTLGALSVTAKSTFQEPFRPLLPDVSHVPYGDVPALRAVLAEHPGEFCVIVEPVQGEGGVVIPPAGYLSAVRAACSGTAPCSSWTRSRPGSAGSAGGGGPTPRRYGPTSCCRARRWAAR